MRVEIKGDPVTAFGSRSKAGMRFELDGGFPDVDVADLTIGTFLAQAKISHSTKHYIDHFPSLL